MNSLAEPLVLPCGATLPNRLAKAAMTEGLADADDRATEAHCTLYQRWSEGGCGLLITGNVMVDRRFLERPGNVALDDNNGHDALRAWAAAGTSGGNHLWMQISHPGRQCTRMSSSRPVAPSSVPMRGMIGLMARPRTLEEAEIEDIIGRFAHVAGIAKSCGFTGVQVHSAHGYLSSQFLSPRTNLRQDRWGGSLENRARFVLETVRAVRAAVGDDFPIGVKLNSADFQKGGFSEADSVQVATWLAEEGIDLLEISGGNYEQMAQLGQLDEAPKAQSTRRREAYFLDYARTVRKHVKRVPLMVTGGFRSPASMKDALNADELEVVGLGRPLCVVPNAGARLLAGEEDRLPAPELDRRLGRWLLGRNSPIHGMRTLNGAAEIAWFYRQILALANGEEPNPNLGTWRGLMAHFSDEFRLARQRTFRKRRKALPANA